MRLNHKIGKLIIILSYHPGLELELKSWLNVCLFNCLHSSFTQSEEKWLQKRKRRLRQVGIS